MFTKMIKPKTKVVHKYIEAFSEHIPKEGQNVCGDFALWDRSHDATTYILCDGIGSGHQAHISATLCASRIFRSLKNGMSMHSVGQNISSSMHLAKTKDIPFSTFIIVNILNDGHFTIFSYEMPEAIIMENSYAYTLEPRYFMLGHEVVAEVNGFLNEGDSLIIFTDGVSQAGMGLTYPLGWMSRGVADYVNQIYYERMPYQKLLQYITDRCYDISGNRVADDTSIVALSCRRAKCINVMSGPPSSTTLDPKFVEDFLKQDGMKVICGSSTADMVSRETGREIQLKTVPTNFADPPSYSMRGIDLVTEGVMTLNQLYNLLEDETYVDDDNQSCVIDLYQLIKNMDIVRFFIGEAENDAHETAIFKQLKIIKRKKIIPVLKDKLEKMGKLVLVENY